MKTNPAEIAPIMLSDCLEEVSPMIPCFLVVEDSVIMPAPSDYSVLCAHKTFVSSFSGKGECFIY